MTTATDEGLAPFPEIQHWFFQKLDQEQRWTFLSVWTPMERTIAASLTLHMQLEALRAIYHRTALQSSAPRTSDVTEDYSGLILSCPGIDDPESDSFMRGFAYGRFSTLDSELARHWGVSRGRPLDECPIGDEPRNLLASAPVSESRVEVLEAALREARELLNRYRQETPPGHSPHMICHKADAALAKIDTALSNNQGAGAKESVAK